MKWYDIKGFPIYEISENCIVRHKETGRHIKLCHNRLEMRVGFGVNTERYKSFSEARLLYCAVKEINPLETKGSFLFTFKRESNEKKFENITVYERSDVRSVHKNFTRQPTIPKNEFYEQCISFSKCVLLEDASALYNEINKYENEIKKHISYFVKSQKTIIRAYNLIIAEVVENVISGNYRVVHPLTYIKRLIKLEVKRNKGIINFINESMDKGKIVLTDNFDRIYKRISCTNEMYY
ncbi:MAG: hypothetical protein LBJ63_12050 [Prevotellaceae bacterium]|jgi:hypothetical protein|nr:hypothetical protein [Prevotellaceae bacterium]